VGGKRQKKRALLFSKTLDLRRQRGVMALTA
jgi:hypothetical protein